jgi:hypothetical protein
VREGVGKAWDVVGLAGRSNALEGEYGVRSCESFRGKWIVIRRGRGGERRGVVPPYMIYRGKIRYRTRRRDKTYYR